jgi:NTP pyrophosphatase (non-canonical NTP hydrolase)
VNIADYQKEALKSLAIKDKSSAALVHRMLGLNGEVGIISNQVKKAVRDNDGALTDQDKAVLREKIGDTLYYAVALADFADLNIDEILKDNIAKSQKFTKSRKA